MGNGTAGNSLSREQSSTRVRGRQAELKKREQLVAVVNLIGGSADGHSAAPLPAAPNTSEELD